MNYKIGSFRQLTGLSDGTLRYYEKIGLIQPARDEANDYRYYDELNFLQVVQIKQLSSFDIQLGDLPRAGQAKPIEEMRGTLALRREALEAEIKGMYDRLARIKLHESFFTQSYPDAAGIHKDNIRGIYRLFVSDPEVARHPATERIAQRWLSHMPYAHATLRIALGELKSRLDGPYGVHLGIGMLERYFAETGDKFREPMQYSAPNTSVSGTIRVRGLNEISRSDLEPFFAYMDDNSLVPCDDMFGWIVYMERSGENSRYYVSLRISVA